MQDELKKVISQAMDTNLEVEQESIAQSVERELSDEALETVAGGGSLPWYLHTRTFFCPPPITTIRLCR